MNIDQIITISGFVVTILITISTVLFKSGQSNQKIDSISDDLKEIKTDLKEMRNTLTQTVVKVNVLEESSKNHNNSLSEVKMQFDNIISKNFSC